MKGQLLGLSLAALLYAVSCQEVLINDPRQTGPPCGGDTTFLGWTRPQMECYKRVNEATGIRTMQQCEQTCQFNNTCLGFVWEGDMQRCSMQFGCDASVGTFDAVQYRARNCGNQPKRGDSGTETRAADYTGQDNSPDKRCILHCPPIPKVKYALHSGTSNKAGVYVMYECQMGTMVGNATITCMEDRETKETWWSEQPKCVL